MLPLMISASFSSKSDFAMISKHLFFQHMVVRWIHKHIIEIFLFHPACEVPKIHPPGLLPPWSASLCLFQILHNALDCIRI